MGAVVGLERQWRQRMAGTRTNALVAAGAAALVMCAFMVRDTSRSEAQIVSYVVSGVRFGAISGLGNPLHALILAAAVLCANIVLRPLAYREAHMRALMLQAMSRSPLTLTSLRSEDIEGDEQDV